MSEELKPSLSLLVKLGSIAGTGDYYQNDIYTNRFLPKWVYRGPEYTMIVVDTHTDGNQLLQVFANDKEKIKS
jgi:hypothetical protein